MLTGEGGGGAASQCLTQAAPAAEVGETAICEAGSVEQIWDGAAGGHALLLQARA